MFGFFLLLGLAGIALPVLGGVAFFIALGARRRERFLEARVAALESALAERAREMPAPRVEPAAPTVPASRAPLEPEPAPSPSPIPAVAVPAPRRRGFEERFAGQWGVWLGSGALALAGVFLVRYSIEQGLLGPAARVLLGLLLGLALLAASEWLRRRMDPTLPASGLVARLGVPPANLPPAVAAAGVIALFAATYAAFALYDLILPLTAFAALAAISAGAMALSLLHGPLVAILGQAAAFVVPALIGSREPFAAGLFAYVLAVAAGCLALARYRPWRWTAWFAIAGAGFWTLLWWAWSWTPGDSPWLAIFLAAFGALLALLGPAPLAERPSRRLVTPDLLPDLPVAILLLLAFGLARIADYDPWSLAALLALAGGAALDARRRPALEPAVAFAAAVVVAALATWHLPDILAATTSGEVGFVGAVLTPTASRFLAATIIAGTLFVALGGALLWGTRAPGFWAGLGVATPAAMFALAYWRLEDFAVAPAWAAAALALAAASLGMTAWLARFRDAPGLAAAMGAYAVGVTAGVSLAFLATFRLGALSVALALQIPVLAHLAMRLRLPALRHAAGVIAAIVIARLLLNPFVSDYPLSTTPILNGLLWIYGVPMLAFAIAMRAAPGAGRYHAALLFEAGAIAFAAALIGLEIRHALGGGRLDGSWGGLAELGLHATTWLGAAVVLQRLDEFAPSPVRRWAWRIFASLGALAALVALTTANPTFIGGRVGRWPIANALALAYLLPAVLAAGVAAALRRRGPLPAAGVAGVGALLLGFVWVTLEVARAFRTDGAFAEDWFESIGEGEAYAYSAAWLACGGALLALGLRFASPALRWASLSLVALTVAKVFLLDMAALTGLWRVASFLGLGVVLIGLGWVYQRLVFRRPAAPDAAAPA